MSAVCRRSHKDLPATSRDGVTDPSGAAPQGTGTGDNEFHPAQDARSGFGTRSLVAHQLTRAGYAG